MVLAARNISGLVWTPGPGPEHTTWADFRARFVVRADGCWAWIDPFVTGYGYGRLDGKSESAHNIGFIVMAGGIDRTMDRDHLCRFPACVNPFHVEQVTHGENVRRGSLSRVYAIVCRRGHPLTPENTRHASTGRRSCKTCERLSRIRRSAERVALGLPARPRPKKTRRNRRAA